MLEGRYKYNDIHVFDLFRLFYLSQDSMLKYTKEENFFTCLTWLHPALSGIYVSSLLGENFFISNESHTLFIWHSSCSKIPILWEESRYSIHYNVQLISILIVVITFGIQIAILKRKRQLEKQKPDDGFMVISYNNDPIIIVRGGDIHNPIMANTYNNDGVTISRRPPDKQSDRKLWKHERTGVTPKASLLTFCLSVITLSSQSFFFFNMGPSGPLICGQFIFVLLFCMLFFLFSFIETIFSPTLWNTLFHVFPCNKQKYHVVNI